MIDWIARHLPKKLRLVVIGQFLEAATYHFGNQFTFGEMATLIEEGEFPE